MSVNPRFDNLFQPGWIGQMKLRNRIVMPAMRTCYGAQESYVTRRLRNYYEARARGGVGLIILETSYIHAGGRTSTNQLAISDDKFIPGLSELAQVIQRHGAKVAVQLQHGGRRASSQLTRTQPIAPSSIPSIGGEVPKEATDDDIAGIITSFARAAQRAKQAKLDAIEISATTYGLIGQFMSRASNKRQDTYGGDLRNRARLLVKVIEAVREAVGADYPILCRLNGKEEEGIEDGITVEEAQEIARVAQDAGAQTIDVFAGSSGSPIPVTAQPLIEPLLVYLAEGIKKVVNVPVITAGGSISPEAGESILKERKADFIAMGKALIADPELPNKAASSRLGDIVPCILCMGCVDKIFSDIPVKCSVNAQVGRETEYTIEPTEKPQKVLVIGGGPAGLEAARVAALRGHHVSLYEKGSKLGGQLIQAAIPPYKGKIELLTRYLDNQVRKLGVNVKLDKEATPAAVEETKPDAVIIATGATPLIPDIPGARGENVVTALEALTRYNEVGERVIIAGGGIVGCETAEFLTEKGKRVTILEMFKEIGSDIIEWLRPAVLGRLRKYGVRMEAGVKVVEITEKGAKGVRGGTSEFFEANTVVLAMGMKSERGLARNLEGKVKKLHLAGDCVESRRIKEAIAEGFHIAHEI